MTKQINVGVVGTSRLGVHMIDLAHWLLGDVAQVSAHLPTFIERPGADGGKLAATHDSALLSLKFARGSQGLIHVSAVAHIGQRGQQFQLILYGEDGTLEVESNWADGYVIRGAKHDEDQIKSLPIPADLLKDISPDAGFIDQFVQQFSTQSVGTRLFIDAIVHDLDLSPSFYDGVKAQAVIEAALQADQQESCVSIVY